MARKPFKSENLLGSSLVNLGLVNPSQLLGQTSRFKMELSSLAGLSNKLYE